MNTQNKFTLSSPVRGLCFAIVATLMFNLSAVAQDAEADSIDVSGVTGLFTALNDEAIEDAIAELLEDEDMTPVRAAQLLQSLLEFAAGIDSISETYIFERFNAALIKAGLSSEFIEEIGQSFSPFAGFLATPGVLDVPESNF